MWALLEKRIGGGIGVDCGAARRCFGAGLTIGPSNISFRLRRRGCVLTAAPMDMDGSCEGVVLRCSSSGGDGDGGEGRGRGRADDAGVGAGAFASVLVGAFAGVGAVVGAGAGAGAGFAAGAGRGSRDDDDGGGGSSRGITGGGIGVLLIPVNRYLALTAGRPSDFDFGFELAREFNMAGADFLGLGLFAFTAGALAGFVSLAVRAGGTRAGETIAGEAIAGEAKEGDDARHEGGGGSGWIVWRGIYPRLSKGRSPILAKDWKISCTTYAPQP